MALTSLIDFKLASLILILTGIMTFSYFKFATFSPSKEYSIRKESLVSEREVKNEIPTPLNSQELSSNKYEDGGQTILQTEEQSESVYNFYKNVLLGKKWKLKGDTKIENGYITVYEKNEDLVTISITNDTIINKTIVSVNYSSD
ncbi:hypothetical protein HY419_01855 [candidate division WWE3 bacterium]|nr:hypothetical protein [candidate division WWE3 bacterium]